MQINSNFEIQIKLVVIGDSGVGKTSVILRYTKNTFQEQFFNSIGVDFKSKDLNIDGRKVKLQIWDTAGQERYMSVNKNLFQKVQGIILMYDLTSRESFEHINYWLNLVKHTTSSKTVMLVANKLDIEEDKRIVSEEEGAKVAKDNNILFFEGSGSSGQNVDKIFTTIAEEIYTNLLNDKDFSGNSLTLNRKNKKEKKQCC